MNKIDAIVKEMVVCASVVRSPCNVSGSSIAAVSTMHTFKNG